MIGISLLVIRGCDNVTFLHFSDNMLPVKEALQMDVRNTSWWDMRDWELTKYEFRFLVYALLFLHTYLWRAPLI